MRYFTLGRKLPQLSLGACHSHLALRHAPLVLECQVFREHCLHYRQNHIHGDVDRAFGELRTQSDPTFHYCSEFWFEDVNALSRAYSDPGFVEVLRPDSKLWSDSLERVSVVADELWAVGQDQPPNGSRMVKLLILHGSTAGNDGPGGMHAPKQAGGFFDHCLRATFNAVSGQMDFARAMVRNDLALPFKALSEFWFESPEAAQKALSSSDGRRLIAQGPWFPTHPDDRTTLWATEHVVF